jgi:hypothetical protein
MHGLTLPYSQSIMPELELVIESGGSFSCPAGSSVTLSVKIRYRDFTEDTGISYPGIPVVINGQVVNTTGSGTASYIYRAGNTPGTYSVNAFVNTATYPEFTERDKVEFTITVTERDGDGDGIADSSDQCPDDAEDFDGFEDDDGCPDLTNITLTVEENVDGECMEGRNLSFSAVFDPSSVVGDPAYNLKFNYLGADGVTQIIEDWSWDNIAEKSVSMPNVLDGDEDHYYTTVAKAALFADGQLNSTSNQININVYELWIKDVTGPESKPWKVVVGEDFACEAIASKHCTNWDWDMEDGFFDVWNPETIINGQNASLIINESIDDMPHKDNWDWFGDSYGTLNVFCEDAEGNNHRIYSTEQQTDLKIKVFYKPERLMNPSNQIPNCFYYWQGAYFGDVDNLTYSSSEDYGTTARTTGFITYGDLTNPLFTTPYSHEQEMNNELSQPYTLPRDGLSKIGLFHCVISHELQHRQDFLVYDHIPDSDVLPTPSVDGRGDHLPDTLDDYDLYFNGAYHLDPNNLICNEYEKLGVTWKGDWEYRARQFERIDGINYNVDYSKDWSKGGKQW